MIFADTHTHLYLEEFNEDREQVLQQCAESGVKYLFLPNIDAGSIRPMLDLCSNHEHCYPMMGLHPSEVREDFREALKHILDQMDSDDFVGIGEIGMDLYWDKTFVEEQKVVLAEQLHCAQSRNLPAVIHCRKAFAETWDVLKSFKGSMRGIFHCFAGDIAQAEKVIEKGFLIGVGGTVTYKNSGIQEVVARIGLEHIVIETDSPFLSPVPFRGKRNASYHIPIIAQRIADIKGVSVEEVAATTTENALKLFIPTCAAAPQPRE